MNPFKNINSTCAEGYGQARPQYHKKSFEFLDDLKPFHKILDLCCGVGNSTVALCDFSSSVLGIDESPAMIAVANKRGRGDYYIKSAYDLDFQGKDLYEICRNDKSCLN